MSETNSSTPDAWQGRACAWPRREQNTDRITLIDPADFPDWIVHEDDDLLVINKTGEVVCHPSKAGPWSSLIGAAREYTGLEKMHLVFRLDRETSGIVVLAKNPSTASLLQKAVQDRRIHKTYRAILTGKLKAPVTVDQPLGPDDSSPVFVKDRVRGDGKSAISVFDPIRCSAKFTLARVKIETGRKHQIRAHAQWLGHSVVGDKIYGPDDRCYLEFIDHGWTDNLARKLLMRRQALHCAEIDLREVGGAVYQAPMAADMQTFLIGAGLGEGARLAT